MRQTDICTGIVREIEKQRYKTDRQGTHTHIQKHRYRHTQRVSDRQTEIVTDRQRQRDSDRNRYRQ